jgi:hypothetical protein
LSLTHSTIKKEEGERGERDSQRTSRCDGTKHQYSLEDREGHMEA